MTAAMRARKKANHQARHRHPAHLHVQDELGHRVTVRCLTCKPLPQTPEQRAARAYIKEQAALAARRQPAVVFSDATLARLSAQVTALFKSTQRTAQRSSVLPFTRRRGARNT